MLKVVCLMLGGVLVGYLFRHRNLAFIQKLISVAIWTLLFLLGIAVGGNEQIMGDLRTIGVQALVLSVGGVGGSVCLAAWVYRTFFRKQEDEHL